MPKVKMTTRYATSFYPLLRAFPFLLLLFAFVPSGKASTLDSLNALLERTNDPEEKIRLASWVYVQRQLQGIGEDENLSFAGADSIVGASNSRETKFAYLIVKAIKTCRTGELEKGFGLWDEADAMRSQVSASSEAVFLTIFSPWLVRVSDTQLALSYANRAIVLQDSLGDKEGLAVAYRIKGTALNGMSDFQQQQDAFFKALALYREVSEPNGEAWTLNWLGKFYKENEKYDLSQKYYSEVALIKDKVTAKWMVRIAEDTHAGNSFENVSNNTSDDELYALIAKRRAEGHKLDELYFALAMGYKKREQYDKSYSALLVLDSIYAADEPDWLHLAHHIHKGINRLRSGHYQDALTFFEMAYQPQYKAAKPEEYMEACKGIAQTYLALGKPEQAAPLLVEVLEIVDSLFSAESAQSVANLEIAYETEKKQLEISRLQTENEIQDLTLRRNNLIRNGLIGLAVLLLALLGTIILLLRNRQKLHLERMRSRISSDLHDDVGGILAGLAMQTELAKAQPNKMTPESIGRLADTARKAMGRMRDIVWVIDRDKSAFQDLLDRMYEHANETLEPANIDFQLQHKGIAPTKILSADQRQHLYLIFKEAITNAAKYSEASSIEVSITNSDQGCTLTIRDDGKGFADDRREVGNGINNMHRRGSKLKGELSMQSGPQQGTTIRLEIPQI